MLKHLKPVLLGCLALAVATPALAQVKQTRDQIQFIVRERRPGSNRTGIGVKLIALEIKNSVEWELHVIRKAHLNAERFAAHRARRGRNGHSGDRADPSCAAR